MEILKEIVERKSIRNFTSAPVENEILQRILEAGRLSPSAKNRQEWRFVIIRDREIRERIKTAAFSQECFEQAPVVIALCTTNIEYRMPNGQLSYPIDTAFAASFMILQAVHEGLGACCVSTFDEHAVREILTVPFGMRVVLLVALGYAARMPIPTERKPIEKIISYNHW